MSEFKEFQGKNLDEAINNACDYFDLNRDKLEIEILSGGSTGVFGLVGKKNAKVKARPRGGDNNSLINEGSRKSRPRPQRNERPVDRRDMTPTQEAPQAPVAKENTAPAPRAEAEIPAVKSESEIAVKEEGELAVKSENDIALKTESEVAVREEVPAPVAAEESGVEVEAEEAKTVQTGEASEDVGEAGEYRERRSIMEGDPEDIAAAVREALEMMIEPIVQQKPKLEIEVGEDRVNVLVDDEENSGLIIGREGQTLSSLQYLCNRMVSKKLQTSVRVQIDTGDYRERQDEKLRQLAWHLADKAMHTGRVQSTKPLSSYHRRVVHMALQEDKYVNTRSKGEGPMKRVLILPRRSRGAGGEGVTITTMLRSPTVTIHAVMIALNALIVLIIMTAAEAAEIVTTATVPADVTIVTAAVLVQIIMAGALVLKIRGPETALMVPVIVPVMTATVVDPAMKVTVIVLVMTVTAVVLAMTVTAVVPVMTATVIVLAMTVTVIVPVMTVTVIVPVMKTLEIALRMTISETVHRTKVSGIASLATILTVVLTVTKKAALMVSTVNVTTVNSCQFTSCE